MDELEKEKPLKPLSAKEILKELAESRDCYEHGEYQDFDDALDEISEKYGLQQTKFCLLK